MRIAIFGSGGVGGYFGGRLAQAGEDVVFIARGTHLRALQSEGLRVDSIKGDFHLVAVQATDDPSAVGRVDAVLACTKAWQIPEAAEAMAAMMDASSFAVPLVNGIEAPEQLAAALGASRVLGGLCKIMSFLVEPGHVRHAGVEPSVAFGELDGRSSDRVERLQAAFERAGVTVEKHADIHEAMWKKFLFIASFSGVAAVARAPAGAIRSVPETRSMLEEAMREVAAVALARGTRLSDSIVAANMSFVDSLPADGTASMQRDVLEGRPSELEAQSGAVVRLGGVAGVETPVHRFLYAALLPGELAARKRAGKSG